MENETNNETEDEMVGRWKPDINTGTLIQIIIMVATIVWMFTVVQAQVNANTRNIEQIQDNILRFQKKVRSTYVRKDVQKQILYRLKQLEKGQDALNEKIDQIQKKIN